MRFLKNAARWLSKLRESTDRAFMASTLAQVGERGLAREIMAGPSEEEGCCRAVWSDRECSHVNDDRCTLAIERGW